MPLDFPTSPTNGQTYNGYVYSTSVGAWQAKPAAQSPFYTSDTPPSNPVAGDSWFNTNDGTMYIYYNDGNTSQWTEHRSEIAKSQVGMVPMKPASVVVGSGTGSVDVNGLVAFAGSTSVSLNNVFSSSYKYYRIMFEITASTANGGALFRFRNAGTDLSSASYGQSMFITRTNGATQTNSGGGTTGVTVLGTGSYSGQSFVSSMDISNPVSANNKSFTNLQNGGDATSNYAAFLSGYVAAGSQDGFSVIMTAGNVTGFVKVYGYN